MLTDKTIKHVLGTSELTCLLPLRAGIIPKVLDTHTYAARAVIGLRLLHTLRLQSREVQRVRPVVDAVDAIRSIHAFSFSIVDNKILLSVTFDKPWEPYIRIIWRDLGPVLDLVLCNCEGYDQPALEQGYEKFVAWIMARQVQSEFFFAQGRVTVDDQRYLAEIERMSREGRPETDLATLQVPSPVDEAVGARQRNTADAAQQYGALLLALYGLRDMYEDDDAKFLASATHLLMRGVTDPGHGPVILDLIGLTLPAEVAWFKGLSATTPSPALVRTPPADEEVQGGILAGYRGMTHGCVLLWRITDPDAMGAFLRGMGVTSGNHQNSFDLVSNVAFTTSGLEKLGVPEADLARFPKEFREGMAARAGLLGDVRGNHPENWPLPEWNWRRVDGKWTLVPDQPERVHLSSVDMVITLRARTPGLDDNDANWFETESEPDSEVGSETPPPHPLRTEVRRLTELGGAELMSVQLMRTYRPVKGAQEPFGFRDGISQPCVGMPGHPDDVPYGDFVVGHKNSRHDPPFAEPGKASRLGEWEQGSLIDNGSFLAVRKMRQYVNRLRAKVEGQGSRQDLLSEMVGRTPLGVPLADPGKAPGSTNAVLNQFDYASDARGMKCPFDSHIRRTNPRTDDPNDPAAPKIPRIARRGMSYGPPTQFGEPVEKDAEGNVHDPDRGTVFMAYNASIAEQFEVIQRWITGGNSTGLSSAQVDPLMRVPDAAAGPFTFRFVDASGTVTRVNLGNDPFVTLEWGLYLFAPSMAAIQQLAQATRKPAAGQEQVKLGAAVIARLQSENDWAAVMEDLVANRAGIQSAVLAAITALHGGVLRTKYGVIVTTRDLRDQVLLNDDIYSVRAYLPRMKASVGEGYLGHDSQDPEYADAAGPNSIVGGVTRPEAFAEARKVTTGLLRQMIAAQVGRQPRIRLEMVLDLALAELCRIWFGVPDDKFIQKGKPNDLSAPTSVHLPYHSLAPSRYIFSSPDPRDEVTRRGEAFGAALLAQVLAFVQANRATSSAQGTLGAKLFASIPSNDPLLARTLVGMIEGFLPTVYGNLMKVMNLWLSEEQLWSVQHAYLASGGGFGAADQYIAPALRRAMQRRPVPDLLFRTATRATTLGGEQIEPGDVVVTSIVAITEQEEKAGIYDETPVFGGDRRQAPHPTHACPAIEMGLGVMEGFLAAVLELREIRATPSFLVITVG